jgi:hypothetical protein
MPAITLAICGNQIFISARSPRLIRLFADYFSYYTPISFTPNDQSPHSAKCEPALQIELRMREQLPPREQLIPQTANLVSQTGVVGLWHQEGKGRQGDEGAWRAESAIRIKNLGLQSPIPESKGRFFFDLGVAAFRVDVEAGKIVGLVTPEAMK